MFLLKLLCDPNVRNYTVNESQQVKKVSKCVHDGLQIVASASLLNGNDRRSAQASKLNVSIAGPAGNKEEVDKCPNAKTAESD